MYARDCKNLARRLSAPRNNHVANRPSLKQSSCSQERRLGLVPLSAVRPESEGMTCGVWRSSSLFTKTVLPWRIRSVGPIVRWTRRSSISAWPFSSPCSARSPRRSSFGLHGSNNTRACRARLRGNSTFTRSPSRTPGPLAGPSREGVPERELIQRCFLVFRSGRMQFIDKSFCACFSANLRPAPAPLAYGTSHRRGQEPPADLTSNPRRSGKLLWLCRPIRPQQIFQAHPGRESGRMAQ
jgi:hypothetical protein